MEVNAFDFITFCKNQIAIKIQSENLLFETCSTICNKQFLMILIIL